MRLLAEPELEAQGALADLLDLENTKEGKERETDEETELE